MSTVEIYRRLAAETRAMGKAASAPDIKAAFEQLALDYDRLASEVERQSFPWWKK